MRAAVMVEPQEGMTYDQLLHIGRRARERGLEGLFRSDHYQGLGGASLEPATDAWATLAGLVRDLADGVVGTLVSPVTFRHPGQLAKAVATVAHMSAGPSVELGLGTGWNEGEHKAYGFVPFGSFGDRFKVLSEYLPVVKGLLSGEEFSFAGDVYTLENVTCRPAAPDVRIIVGGGGPRRTPALAARYADELNVVGFLPPAAVAERVATCKGELERHGRDATSFTFSWMGPFLIGKTEAELSERAARFGAARRADADAVLGRMRGRGPVGTLDEAAGYLRALADAGVQRVMMQHMLIDDDDHLALAAEVAAAAAN